ncbi:Cupredoxin [Dipodascopsis uninucleata]
MLLKNIFGLASLVAAATAATVQYDFSIDYVTANPDGAMEKKMVGVNGAWPPPPIYVNKGDRLIVNLTNNLGDQPTSLHFHGIYQNGTTAMDGPVGVTQCAIPPGSNFIYNFTVNQVGTYWYHSHYSAQYPNGLRAPLIVYDDDEPFKDLYDIDTHLVVSEYYHDDAFYLLKYEFLNIKNPTGAEPIPDANLLNETTDYKWNVKPNTTYKLRIINIGGFVSQYIWFEGHNMTVVEVDGIYVEPYVTDRIYITVAQRYTVLITTKNETSTNYAFVGAFNIDMLDTLPDDLVTNSTGWMVYDDDAEFPEPLLLDEWEFLDDFDLVPVEKIAPYDPDYTITVTVDMINLGNGVNYAFFNNITYVQPTVPSLYTVMSSGNDSADVTIYGSNTNTFVLQHNEVVEIVVNNADTGTHPFHLHGHFFQIVERSPASDDDLLIYDASNPGTINEYPVRRDTAYLRPQGYMVLRFIANNPGVWFFHCHIEWHLEQGLALTLVEAPALIQANQVVPDDHYAACKAGGYDYEGNAAGNTANLFDLTGEPVQPKDLPTGFTAKGIVALVFSCVSAFLGMFFIGYYGSTELKYTEKELATALGESDEIESTEFN